MKLYLLLLGAEAPGRVVEQHDYFFGIAENLAALIPDVKAFWPEAGASLHIDGWREVTKVDDYAVRVIKHDDLVATSTHKLFFLNLGGYTSGKLEEQHYTLLTVQESRLKAVQAAKNNLFFKTNSLKGIATAHIDEKYGVDVDSVHHIEDLISPHLKAKYRIVFDDRTDLPDDKIHLGYFKLDKIR
ncbi:DUF1543 domain-containing protein [Mucilaginibacter jinjuensis]|uniref:DUF1543 domain-containing protein n=1 Tax=Mucilaginibacter jinjuensis TaxID=1176721 RepID=A0ABY7TC55_9SPHI|nr:DUF1543 domain-containing protein [Mucilaginibacter jinjuensis]WCT13764.1 DUF1543 domain-containing protein [Mucilaginibacter jinjuensis]